MLDLLIGSNGARAQREWRQRADRMGLPGISLALCNESVGHWLSGSPYEGTPWLGHHRDDLLMEPADITHQPRRKIYSEEQRRTLFTNRLLRFVTTFLRRPS